MHTHLESYEDRQIPDKEKCIQWCSGLAAKTGDQKEVAEKFKKQLEYLFVTCEEDGYQKLHERTDAAVKYFIGELDKLTASAKKHINDVKHKKQVKRYVKDIEELTVLFERKKQKLQQAFHLAKALKNSVNMNQLLQMVEQNKKVLPAALPEQMKAEQAKPEKGETRRISLQMFKQGKSIADIATERGFSQGTIEGHLAAFVTTGEVDILDLVDNTTLQKLISLIEAEPEISYRVLKEQGNISYGSVNAVINYAKRLKKELADPASASRN